MLFGDLSAWPTERLVPVVREFVRTIAGVRIAGVQKSPSDSEPTGTTES